MAKDKLKELAEQAARLQLQARNAQTAKRQRLLDLLSKDKDSANEQLPYPYYGGPAEAVVRDIMAAHPDFDEDEIRREIYDLY